MALVIVALCGQARAQETAAPAATPAPATPAAAAPPAAPATPTAPEAVPAPAVTTAPGTSPATTTPATPAATPPPAASATPPATAPTTESAPAAPAAAETKSATTAQDTEFKELVSTHIADVQEFLANSKEAIIRDAFQILNALILQYFGYVVIAEALIYFVLAMVASKMFAPYRATIVRALMFTGVQVGVAFVAGALTFVLLKAVVIPQLASTAAIVMAGSNGGEVDVAKTSESIDQALPLGMSALVSMSAFHLFVGPMLFDLWGVLTPMAILVCLFNLALILGGMVGAAMWIYEVPVNRAMPFGVGIFFATMVLASIAGAGAGSYIRDDPQAVADLFREDFAKAFLPHLERDLANLKKDNDARRLEYEAVQADIRTADAKAAEVEAEIKRVNDQIAVRKNSDDFIYAKLGGVYDPKTENFAAAISTYEKFAQDRPQSPYAPLAQAQVERLRSEQQTLKSTRDTAAKDAAATRAANLAAFRQKVRNGEATLSEIRAEIFEKERREVIEILGEPTEQPADHFVYAHMRVVDPLTHDKKPLLIRFSQGKVQTVDYAKE